MKTALGLILSGFVAAVALVPASASAERPCGPGWDRHGWCGPGPGSRPYYEREREHYRHRPPVVVYEAPPRVVVLPPPRPRPIYVVPAPPPPRPVYIAPAPGVSLHVTVPLR